MHDDALATCQPHLEPVYAPNMRDSTLEADLRALLERLGFSAPRRQIPLIPLQMTRNSPLSQQWSIDAFISSCSLTQLSLKLSSWKLLGTEWLWKGYG
eukprot:IDg18117t1